MFQKKEKSFIIDLQISLREQSIFGWLSFTLGVNRKPQILVQPSKGSSLEWKKVSEHTKEAGRLAKVCHEVVSFVCCLEKAWMYLGVCTKVYFDRILSKNNSILFQNIADLLPIHLTFGSGRERQKIMNRSSLHPLFRQSSLS